MCLSLRTVQVSCRGGGGVALGWWVPAQNAPTRRQVPSTTRRFALWYGHVLRAVGPCRTSRACLVPLFCELLLLLLATHAPQRTVGENGAAVADEGVATLATPPVRNTCGVMSCVPGVWETGVVGGERRGLCVVAISTLGTRRRAWYLSLSLCCELGGPGGVGWGGISPSTVQYVPKGAEVSTPSHRHCVL